MSGTGWAWSFFPRRLRSDEGFLGLAREDRGVLRELYDAADKWGRGPADRMALMQSLATLDGYDAAPALQRLASAGFVRLWSGDGRKVWGLTNWETDAPNELVRKRKGRSDYPDPPAVSDPGSASGPDARTADSVRPPSGHEAPTVPPPSAPRPPNVRTPPGPVRQIPEETRRDETRRDEAPASGSGARAPAHAPTRVQEPPAPPMSPPPPPLDPRATQALRLWLAHLAKAGPTHCIADDVVASVARDFSPEVFARGVEAHIGDEAKWWQKHPLQALRKRCEWARDKPPDAPSQPRSKPPRTPPPAPAPFIPEKRHMVIRADQRKVAAYAKGRASPDVAAEVEGAELWVIELDGTQKRQPLRDWPKADQDQALERFRTADVVPLTPTAAP